MRALGRLLLPISAVGCLAAAALAAAPPEIGDGWRVSEPAEQGLDPVVLGSMAARVRSEPAFAHAYALLVARHGTLVFEEHFNGRHREQRADVRSVTKSVLSMAIGIARGEGRLPRSLDTPLVELLPGYAHLLTGDKERITLFDLLTMQAGLRWQENAEPWLSRMLFDEDLAEFTLGEPLITQPGTQFNYNTGLSQVLAEALTVAAGRPFADYVRDRLLAPLGIVGSDWLQRPNGTHHGGLGLGIRPRDMAKLGQLALQHGNWRGRRVVPADWLRDATRDHTADASTYGYHWWGSASGERFIAIGYGGQYVWVDRARDLVLVLQVDFDVPFERDVPFAAFLELRDALNAGVLVERAGEIAPVAASPIEVDESSGALQLELVRSGHADGSVEIAYRAVAGSARAGADFAATAASVVWRSGEAGPKTIAIPLVDDRREEDLEHFEVELEQLAGLDRLAASRVRVVVRDDDGAAGGLTQRVSLLPSTMVATEGEPARFTVARDADAGTVEVAWVAAPIFGSSEDLEPSSGVVTLGPGTTSNEVVLLPRVDATLESPQIFRVELSMVESGGPARVDESLGVATLAVLDAAESRVCEPGGALCLHDGRFRVRVSWRAPSAAGEDSRGVAGAAPLSSETGWFWFFDPDNLELLVKVLDGGAINQSYWLYYGVLSDVELFLLVEDLATGRAKIYHRAPGSLCGGADVEAFPSSSRVSLAAARSSAARRSAPAAAANQPSLLGGRFTVEVEWRDPQSGLLAPATSIAVTDATALQWFFSPGNFDLATKVLDGSTTNGHVWLFAGALTDVGYRITVTDTTTGAARSYDSTESSGEPFCGLADVELFVK